MLIALKSQINDYEMSVLDPNTTPLEKILHLTKLYALYSGNRQMQRICIQQIQDIAKDELHG